MSYRLHTRVSTPDGAGLYIAPFTDPQRPDEPLCQVAVKIPLASYSEDDLARLCARYPTMTREAQQAYKKKSLSVNRIYRLDEIEEITK